MSQSAHRSESHQSQIASTGAPDGVRTVAPVRAQYLHIKRRFPDTILLFRLGDFYETFEQDAEIASQVLDIVLTSRDLGKGVRVAMAGIPHRSSEVHIARLVAAGHRVAVCEQIGSAEKGRGLMDRDVARVVTPGTVTDPTMLDSNRNTYVVAVALDGSRCGIAFADLSTGQFEATQFSASTADDARAAAARELLRLGAAEVVIPDSRGEGDPEHLAWLPQDMTVSTTERWHWSVDRAEATLLQHFAVESLDGFGLAHQRIATQAAGALLSYLAETQRSRLAQFASLRTYSLDGYMLLDAQARRNLELAESARGDKRHGLLSVLDESRTPMGARLLRRWLSQPLLELTTIHERQDAVQYFVDDGISRSVLRQHLGKVSDVERMANRAVTGSVTPRELGQLGQSLRAIVEIAQGVTERPGLPSLTGTTESCRRIQALLESALTDEPPATINAAGIIRPGFSPDLDDHDRIVKEAREWIAGLERHERERTGIRSLKVGFNQVSGYFIEVSTTALASATREHAATADSGDVLPSDYAIRQSLANTTRYVTTQLKEYEARLFGAQETLAQLEGDVFRRIVAEVASHVSALCAAAAAIAYLDVVSSLAEVATSHAYVRPVVDDSQVIEIREGRHPTLERILPPGEFVSNDALLDDAGHRLTILTGPNMAGKSSWLRQVALIVLMAQIGSFVPAAAARIGIVDRIFTRIGAQDDITSGQSTFMVEMLETANILHHATSRSLVLLDEIGRGTSTWDGLAIARAVVEYIHNAPRLGCRTLFATHFHEMTAIADVLPGVCCARMEVLEEGDRVVFLHRVAPGGADRSYGIHVAELAGVPKALTRRAREILRELELGPAAEAARGRRRSMGKPNQESLSMQLTLFAPPDPVLEAIRALDVESLSPLEALMKLYELRQLAKGEPSPDR